MTATLQLAFAMDPRRDDLSAAEIAAAEATSAYQDAHRADEAAPAPRCTCRRPFPDEDGICFLCGRWLV